MIRLVMIAVALFSIGACGDDAVGNGGTTVGGPCASNQDCDFRCQLGGDYPQGTCVKPCNVDDDCPEGAYCINKEDGVCLLGCSVPADCRGGYNCEGRENRGHGGDSLVCSN